jgi:hypothetical protein
MERSSACYRKKVTKYEGYQFCADYSLRDNFNFYEDKHDYKY